MNTTRCVLARSASDSPATGKMVLSLTTESGGREPQYAQLVAGELGVPALYAHGSGALPPGVEGGLDAQTVYRD